MNISTKTTSNYGVIVPEFSWTVKNCKDPFQKAYEIKVSDSEGNLIWNSGYTESRDCVRVKYTGEKLKSNSYYYWTVTVYTKNFSQTSEKSFFVTGMTGNEDITWIAPAEDINSPILRKKFNIILKDRAIVNVCGLGFFELYINGMKVSDEIMTPVRTDYDTVFYYDLQYPYLGTTEKSVHYLTYDVTNYLKDGENIAEIWLGNGWFKQKGRLVEGRFVYDSPLKAFFRLTCADQIIVSDESWTYTDSPLVFDNIFYGEIYDAGKTLSAEKPVIKAKAPAGKLISSFAPADKIIYSITPKKAGENIYDTGSCITGFAKITVKGKKGSRVKLYYAEQLKDGKLDFTSSVGYVELDLKQIQKDEYILAGLESEEYMPRFTWHGFRYFSIETEGNAEIVDVTVFYVATDFEKRSEFNCSLQQINRIYDNCLNTIHTNNHGSITMDCPHRERLGYVGDGQFSSNAAMYNFNAYKMYRKWIYDICDAQNKENGYIPHTAPFNGGGGGISYGCGLAVIAWDVYTQYGDEEILKKTAPHIKAWILYLKQRKLDGLVAYEEEGSWCLGDWAVPSPYLWDGSHLEVIDVPNNLVHSVSYLHNIDIYEKICSITGVDIFPFTDERRDIIENINKTYFNGRYYEKGNQGSDAFALFAGAPDKKNTPAVLDHLIGEISSRGYTFDTGFVGTRYLFNVLDRYERNDVVISMLLCNEYPSYGNMLKNGATTIWETWEGTGSQNHTGFCSVGSWIMSSLAGIKPDKTAGGYKAFSVKPFFDPRIDHLFASINTDYGRISVSWKRENGKIKCRFDVPFNTEATILLNGTKQTVLCGEHYFEITE